MLLKFEKLREERPKVRRVFDVAFRTKREKFSHKIEKVRFCKNV